MASSRTIVLTGVSRGLGRALLEGFVARGHRVLGCARSEAAIAQLQQKYSNARLTAVDVADDEQVRQWSRAVLQDATPDLLVNNAGLINEPANLWEISAAEFDSVVGVNLNGVANVIRHFLPPMLQEQQGVIVNFSSGWGRSTSPQVGPYCATKWAIEGLTRSLAQELPSGMAAVALNPGIIHTEMLETCFGGSAKSYEPPERWAEAAVPFLLNLNPRDNGSAATVPG